jgi:hypothetical protein
MLNIIALQNWKLKWWVPVGMAKIQNMVRTQKDGGCSHSGRKFPVKLNTGFPYDPTITLLDIHPNELKTYIHTNICRAALFVSARLQAFTPQQVNV